MNLYDLTDRAALLLGRALIRAEAIAIERDQLKARVAELEAQHNGAPYLALDEEPVR